MNTDYGCAVVLGILLRVQFQTHTIGWKNFLLEAILYKWKNHFYKMKGDVGMSGHEKERKQDAYTKIQTHS